MTLIHSFIGHERAVARAVKQAGGDVVKEIAGLAEVASTHVTRSEQAWQSAARAWTPWMGSYHRGMAQREAQFAVDTLKEAGRKSVTMAPHTLGGTGPILTPQSSEIVGRARELVNNYSSQGGSMVSRMDYEAGRLANRGVRLDTGRAGGHVTPGALTVSDFAYQAREQLRGLVNFLPNNTVASRAA
jgi:hypothetical protein